MDDEYLKRCEECDQDCKQLKGTRIDWCPAMEEDEDA
jgi:hypothetical protein